MNICYIDDGNSANLIIQDGMCGLVNGFSKAFKIPAL